MVATAGVAITTSLLQIRPGPKNTFVSGSRFVVYDAVPDATRSPMDMLQSSGRAFGCSWLSASRLSNVFGRGVVSTVCASIDEITPPELQVSAKTQSRI